MLLFLDAECHKAKNLMAARGVPLSPPCWLSVPAYNVQAAFGTACAAHCRHDQLTETPEWNVAGEPTATGLAVKQLQAELPQARVLYSSATGASEPNNLAYMTRLGTFGYKSMVLPSWSSAAELLSVCQGAAAGYHNSPVTVMRCMRCCPHAARKQVLTDLALTLRGSSRCCLPVLSTC